MNKRLFYSVFSLAFAVLGCTGSNTDNTSDASANVSAAGSTAWAGTTAANQGGTGPSVTGVGGSKGNQTAGKGPSTGAKGGAGGKAGKGSAGSQKGGASGKQAAAAGKGGGGASGACDRKCLIDIMTGYLEALAAKDPSKIKVSSTVRFTNNGVEAKIGDGLWATASKLHTDKRLDYADPILGNVGAQTVFDENGSTPVIYQTRLKVVKREITEIESMEVRQIGAANGFFNVQNMTPEPVWFQEIEPSKRMNREELKVVMELYMDYLEGSKRGTELPFDTNCVRYENGVATASGVASFNAQSWFFQLTRRHLVFDEEAGIVWGMYPFFQTSPTLVVGEAFKIIDGKFMMIQAVMANMPSKAWDTP